MFYQSSEWKQIAVLKTPGLHCRSSDCGDLPYKQGNWKKRSDAALRASGRQVEGGGGVAGGVGRIHPENCRMRGRHGLQYVAQCVACAALTPVVWQ